jgi:uncharacterized protein with PIN domain
MKFLCDHMLGTLAKWLRLMGYDTLYPEPLDDDEMIALAEAEDRRILTRDKELAGRRGSRSLYVASDVLEEQLRQVMADLGLTVVDPMSRCSVCNVPVEEVPKSSVEGVVPEGVYSRQDRFWRCAQCGRHFWRGTHYENIMSTLATLESPQARDSHAP